MTKVHKYWRIHTDLDIGSKADPETWVQGDRYSYLLQLSFVRNRRPIPDLYGLGGEIILKFTLPNDGVVEYELVDIQGDKASFAVPNTLLENAGEMALEIEWRVNGELRNTPTPLSIMVAVNPWEVSLIDDDL